MSESKHLSSNKQGLSKAAIFVGQLPFQLLEVSDLLEELNYKKVLVCESDKDIKEQGLDEVVITNLNDNKMLDDAVAVIGQKYRVEVVFGLSETNVLPAAYIRERIGANGTSMQTATICRNKYTMRKALQQNDVPMPAFYGVNSYKDIEALGLSPSDFPLISKPTLGFASQGVRRADNQAGLIADLKSVKREINHIMGKYYQLDASADSPSIIIESYIAGKEVAVDGIVINGEPIVLLCIDKPDVSSGPYFGDSMHVAPAKLSEKEVSEIERTVIPATKAAGIQNGPFHIEVRLANDNAYLIEIGARIGFPRLVRKSRGLDIVTLSQKVLLNLPVSINLQDDVYSGNLCVNADRNGVFNGVKNKAEIESIDGIDEFILFVSPGERVVTPPKSNTYVGFIIASGDSHEKVAKALTLAKETMVLDISE